MMTPRTALRLLLPLLLIVFGVSFFVNLMSLTLPLYTMQVFDRVMTSRSLDTLWVITALAVFVLCVYALLEMLRSNVMIGIDRWLEQHLFPVIIQTRLARAAEGRQDQQREGLNDLQNLRQFFTGQSILSVIDTIWSPLFILVAFFIDPVLGMIGAMGAIGLLLLSFLNESMVRDPQKAANLMHAKSQRDVEAAARNGEVVAALGMTPTLLRRISESVVEARQQAERASRRSLTVSTITKIFRYLVQVAILAVGIWLTLNDHLTSGAVFAAMMIMGRGLAPFEAMQRTWSTVVSARQSFAQLQKYLGEGLRPTSTLSFPAPRGLLTVENVHFSPKPGAKSLISGVSFGLKPGDALGIIGPSGAGKSCLARLLVGVWRPNSGSIRLDGIDVATWDRGDFGPHVGYVPQDVELLGGTVRENIARFGQASDGDIIQAAVAANAHDLIVRLAKGYDTDVGEGGALLSGGQRQRIALARALFGSPRYIVLDEPNSNLDNDGELAMLNALQAAKQRGATIIIVAHRPSLLTFVDKLLVLKDGRGEMFGDRQAVMARLHPKPAVAAVPDPPPAAAPATAATAAAIPAPAEPQRAERV